MKKTTLLLASLPIFMPFLSANAQGPAPTYIQVDGNKSNALKLLKAGGIVAKETKDQRFVIPTVTIGGNDGPFDLGEQIMLTADYDKTNLPDNLADIKFNWTVLDQGKRKGVFDNDDKTRIAIGAGIKSKTMIVLLDVNFTFETKQKFIVVDKDGKNASEREFIVDVQTISPPPLFAEVVVGDGGTNPNVPDNPIIPKPTPTPAPTFPDGQFGLAQFMYSSFMADTNLDTKSKVVLAGKLADGLEGIASKIAAISTYTDVPTILADTKKANTDVFSSLGIDLTKTAALKGVIGSKISDLWKNQKINTASDISTAWKEMVQGLRAVK